MNISRIRITALVAISISLLASCKLASLEEPEKESVPSLPSTLTEFEVLFHSNTQKVWKAQSFTLGSINGLQNCRLDDTMTIVSDGTYEYNGGQSLCGAEDSQRIKKGTWKILNNGANILFDEGTSTAYVAEVIGLESKKIVLRGTYFGLEINGTYVSN
jgi:hypothetical protein